MGTELFYIEFYGTMGNVAAATGDMWDSVANELSIPRQPSQVISPKITI